MYVIHILYGFYTTALIIDMGGGRLHLIKWASSLEKMPSLKDANIEMISYNNFKQ